MVASRCAPPRARPRGRPSPRAPSRARGAPTRDSVRAAPRGATALALVGVAAEQRRQLDEELRPWRHRVDETGLERERAGRSRSSGGSRSGRRRGSHRKSSSACGRIAEHRKCAFASFGFSDDRALGVVETALQHLARWSSSSILAASGTLRDRLTCRGRPDASRDKTSSPRAPAGRRNANGERTRGHQRPEIEPVRSSRIMRRDLCGQVCQPQNTQRIDADARIRPPCCGNGPPERRKTCSLRGRIDKGAGAPFSAVRRRRSIPTGRWSSRGRDPHTKASRTRRQILVTNTWSMRQPTLRSHADRSCSTSYARHRSGAARGTCRPGSSDAARERSRSSRQNSRSWSRCRADAKGRSPAARC